ncbi:hypothetical protein Pmani_037572 [Petrolisthes manimaculis]|uniref:SGNH hydrolase-type esterase domain-containing protein n=1 Tax=Petrolisthes manimaculis TaxID=1843537 RepID=A0AAE1NFZ9_9EUCA|nr:hypothetical protein Pmani_037572 [Petrolisthes manimaculis]
MYSINMILDNAQPATAPDTARLAAPASPPARTHHTGVTPPPPHDTADSPRHEQAPLPSPVHTQPVMDDSTSSLLPDTAPELRTQDFLPQRIDNMENTQPVYHVAVQLPTLDSTLLINHDAAQPLLNDTAQQTSEYAALPRSAAAPTQHDAHAQSPLPTHSARSNISYCINDNQNEIDTNKTGRDIKNIHDKLVLKDMEIELLNVEVKNAYQLIASLQQRVTALEHHNIITSEGQRQVQALTPPVSHCLLLGDSNLRRVRTSDLGDNSSVKTIHGANVDLVRKRISEQLNNKAPTECVIYCGINDILDESPHEIILDNIGALVTDLKEKNCSMKIYVCQIVPPNNSHGLKENIESFNECLIKWGETNGIIIIKTTPNFKLGTGELDDLCFEGDENNAILSRIGIIRLLDTVTNQCSEFKLCKNWKQLKKSMKLTTVKTDKLVGGDTQHTNRRASHQPPATPASPPTVVQQPPPPLVNRAADPPPPPATSGLGAARPYIPRGPGTINYSPYPPHQGAAPPPPPLSATLHDAAWHSPPYTPATAPHYQPSEMHSGSSSRFHAHVGIPGNVIHHMPRDTASRGPPRIRGQMLGSNNARQFPPYQETRRAASYYPSNSGGFHHSWRPRGAPHGVPSAPYAVHSGRQLPATARHIIPSGWSRTKA